MKLAPGDLIVAKNDFTFWKKIVEGTIDSSRYHTVGGSPMDKGSVGIVIQVSTPGVYHLCLFGERLGYANENHFCDGDNWAIWFNELISGELI